MEEFSIQTIVNGRYLIRKPLQTGSELLIAGFHGYGQTAEDELALLASIPGSETCTLCSIEALHPFYTPKGDPGACWMTSRQRETRIEENVRYVEAVIERVLHPGIKLVFHGFSQGTGMACRAALSGKHRASGVMLLGGDIPPELALTDRRLNVHIARGNRDPIYKQENFRSDCTRLDEAGISHISCSFTGGHEAAAEYSESAGEFLQSMILCRS
ncbi:MAG: phospholipase [Chlorobiaceae bacterium]|nr:phospholipase [Chlorobiaceae bacterium]